MKHFIYHSISERYNRFLKCILNNSNLSKNQRRLQKENRTENVLVLAIELTNKIKKVEDKMKALLNTNVNY